MTENSVITTQAGTLTINPVEIELTADSATKEYDGTALTKIHTRLQRVRLSAKKAWRA
ncbi:hypothetical protein JNO48_05370 [Clostridiales bacterium]|nr:hypothetical protein JNO48_05370 [Clostridiales bacterium]